MAMGSDMLATSEVAEILGVSQSRVRQFVMEGRLKPAGRLGINLLFQRTQVVEFARKKREPGRRPKKSSTRA